jgi:hypothetical protein
VPLWEIFSFQIICFNPRPEVFLHALAFGLGHLEIQLEALATNPNRKPEFPRKPCNPLTLLTQALAILARALEDHRRVLALWAVYLELFIRRAKSDEEAVEMMEAAVRKLSSL